MKIPLLRPLLLSGVVLLSLPPLGAQSTPEPPPPAPKKPVNFSIKLKSTPLGYEGKPQYKIYTFHSAQNLASSHMEVPDYPKYNKSVYLDANRLQTITIVGTDSFGIRDDLPTNMLSSIHKNYTANPALAGKVKFVYEDTNSPPREIIGYKTTRWVETKTADTNSAVLAEYWLAKNKEMALAMTAAFNNPLSSYAGFPKPRYPEKLQTNYFPLEIKYYLDQKPYQSVEVLQVSDSPPLNAFVPSPSIKVMDSPNFRKSADSKIADHLKKLDPSITNSPQFQKTMKDMEKRKIAAPPAPSSPAPANP